MIEIPDPATLGIGATITVSVVDYYIDLQAPPYIHLTAAFDHAAAPVQLVTIAGRMQEGTLVFFDIAQERFGMRLLNSEEVLEYDINSIKSLKLLSAYAVSDPADSSGSHQLLPLKHNARKFHVDFNDGSIVEGKTLGSRVDKNGIHFYWLVENEGAPSHCHHYFVSNQAVQQYLIGDRIGAVLVDAASISGNDLTHALGEQQKSRTARIGEYLLSHQVVDSDALEEALAKQKAMPYLRLGEILLSEDLITASQLEYALKEQKRHVSMPLGELLISKGLLSRSQLQQSLARKMGIPFVNLKEFVIEPDMLKRVSATIAFRFNVIPLYQHESKLIIAIENPLNWEVIEGVRFALGCTIDAVMASHADITWALQFYYSAEDINELELNLPELDQADDARYDMQEFARSESEAVSDNVVVRIVDKIILDAIRRKVSDIHIEPGIGNQKVLVRFRKDGTLSNYYKFPSKYSAAIISRVKVMARIDISQRYKPQDGKIRFKHSGRHDIELRVATIPTSSNIEDVVIRLLAPGKALPLTSIGLNSWQLDRILDLTSRPNGLFLVCGPTGSGKTTTLHAVLGQLNTPEKKIWTAEDPVEITQPGLRQVSINPKLGTNFDSVIRAFLRADPDIIMIGEIRDKETADIAIEASLTGHLVLSTLHTNSAVETVVRLLDIGMDEFNFADSLRGVLSQRLVKSLCASCKTPYLAHNDELQMLASEYLREGGAASEDGATEQLITQWREEYFGGKDIRLFRATGCNECLETGYRGRIGIYELLEGSASIKKLILEKASTVVLQQEAQAHGMRSIKQDGIDKVISGLTDYAQIRVLGRA